MEAVIEAIKVPRASTPEEPPRFPCTRCQATPLTGPSEVYDD